MLMPKRANQPLKRANFGYSRWRNGPNLQPENQTSSHKHPLKMREKFINSIYLFLISLNGVMLVKYGWEIVSRHVLHSHVQGSFTHTSLAAALTFVVLAGLQYLTRFKDCD